MANNISFMPYLVIAGRKTPNGRVLRPIFYTAKHANEAAKKARAFPDTLIEFRSYDGSERRWAVVRGGRLGYYKEDEWSIESGLTLVFDGYGVLR